MIVSMTGFAAVTAELPGVSLAVELRSVNHRYLDLQLRLPDELRVLEGELVLEAAFTMPVLTMRLLLPMIVSLPIPPTTLLKPVRCSKPKSELKAMQDVRPGLRFHALREHGGLVFQSRLEAA